ncbi:hypothetical protein, partial [Streptomyces brasiliscabiei]|uniref:hypothetical protein n=1 Tax=Streptomyces brasiliscabiei TaxID=2736302 RepID=UPI0030154615
QALRSAREPDDNTVLYLTTHGEQQLKTLNVGPINVGQLVGPKLAAVSAVVVTSATISVHGSFDDITRQLGLDLATRVQESG